MITTAEAIMRQAELWAGCNEPRWIPIERAVLQDMLRAVCHQRDALTDALQPFIDEPRGSCVRFGPHEVCSPEIAPCAYQVALAALAARAGGEHG